MSRIEFFENLRSVMTLILRFGTEAEVGPVPSWAAQSVDRWQQLVRQSRLGQKPDEVREPKRHLVDTALTALVVKTGLDILATNDDSELEFRLVPLIRMFGVTRAERPSAVLPTALAYIVRRAARRARETEGGPTIIVSRQYSERFAYEFTSVPVTYWNEWWSEDLQRLFAQTPPLKARLYCSATLLRLSGVQRRDATRVLGVPNSYAIFGMVGSRRDWTPKEAELFRQAMVAAAERLQNARDRPDYRQRMELLAGLDVIPVGWLPRGSQPRPRTLRHRQLAAVWLWCYLTGGMPQQSPAWRGFMSAIHLTLFIAAVLPGWRDRLVARGRPLLGDRSLGSRSIPDTHPLEAWWTPGKTLTAARKPYPEVVDSD